MSLINDALKQARQAPPRNPPSARPVLPPAGDEAQPVTAWFIAVLVLILIVAAIFFIGWAVAHRSVHIAEPAVTVTETVTVTQLVTSVPPVVTPKPVESPPVNPPDAPVLQGIFYSPTSPAAIVNGKTVRPGDQVGPYRVKAISKYTVTFVGPDKNEFQIGMSN